MTTNRMEVQKRGRAKKRSLWLIGGLMLLGSTVVVSKQASTSVERRRASPEVRSSDAPAAGGAVNASQAQQTEFKSMVRVFIHPDDIYPLVATVRPGKVIISAENNAGKDIAIVVEPVLNPGHSIGRVATPVQDKRDKQEFTLAAGEYEFYEESRPKRRGKLIVDPKFR